MIKAIRRPDMLGGLILFSMLAYFLFPYVSHRYEFSHNDVVYNYAPFREWFVSHLRAGRFPIWDPMMGLGRFAEVWTTLPVDVLTPLEMALPGLPFSYLFALQMLILGAASYWGFRKLDFDATSSCLGVILFIFAPATSYFVRYYITIPPMVLYTLAFVSLFKYLTTGQRRFLLVAVANGLLFTVGGKVDFEFQILATICGGLIFFLFFLEAAGRSVLNLFLTGTAMCAPVLVHWWYLNLVATSASQSIRPSPSAFSLSGLLSSLGAIFTDPRMVIVLAAIFLLLMFRKPVKWKSVHLPLRVLIAAGLVASTAFAILAGSWAYLVGILMGAIVSYLSRAPGPLRWNRLLEIQVLIYYFCRPIPGEVEEVLIMNQTHFVIRIAISFLATVGLSSIRETVKSWAMACAMACLTLRTLGLPLLSHLAGIVWIPARDNYLLDLPMAVLAVLGFDWLMQTGRLRRWSRPLVGFVLVVVVTGLSEASRYPRTVHNDPLFSDNLRTEMGKIAAEIPAEGIVPPRVLGYFHGYRRLFGMADVREYQSLNAKLYGLYSISSRLNVPVEDVTNVGSLTGGTSDLFRAMIKKMTTIESKVRNLPPGLDFYYHYVVNAVPPLDCVQLRLLGVEFIEGLNGRYYSSNAQQLNQFYSLTEPQGIELAKDVSDKITRCGFQSVSYGGRDFWRIQDPMPRAFLIDLPILAPTSPSDVKGIDVGQRKLIIGNDVVKWSPATIKAYDPNTVIIEATSDHETTLILTELYSQFWRAEVNGAQVEVTPAFGLFRSVSIPKGASSIKLSMEYPKKIKTLIITGMALFLLILLGVLIWSRPGPPAVEMDKQRPLL
ncbi:MAG: hypothetical protein AB7F86_10585 [Bdellovibrionales bacterium]